MALGFIRRYKMSVATPPNKGSITQGVITDCQVHAQFTYNSTGTNADPDVHKIQVFNLGKEATVALREKGARVTFQAGYQYEDGSELEDSDLPTIFYGEVVTSEVSRTGSDTVVELTLSSGYSEFKEAVISEVFEEGSYLTELLDTIILESGLDSVVALGDRDDETIPYVKTLNGTCVDVLEEVCKSFHLRWYIEKNTVYVVTSKQPQMCRIGEPIFQEIDHRVKGDVSWTVEDSTEKDAPQVVQADMTLFLLPSISLGNRIALKLEDSEVTLTVVSIQHVLDYYGDSWETNIIADNKE